MTPQDPVTGQAGQWPAQLALRSQHADPQNAVYIAPEDTLYLVCWSSVAVTLTANIRILPPSGPINIGLLQFAVSASRTPQVFTLPAGEGFVLGAVLQGFTTNNLRRGQCYCVLMFLRGSITGSGQYTQALLAGYPTAQTPLFYPMGRVGDSFEGRGNIRSITGTTPAAGAEISEVVPTGAIWRVISFHTQLTASAVAATRTPLLLYDDGVNVLIQFNNTFTITAGLTHIYYWSYVQAVSSDSFSNGYLPIADGIYLPAGFRIRSNTGGLQAGDQYQAPLYMVEEWIQS